MNAIKIDPIANAIHKNSIQSNQKSKQDSLKVTSENHTRNQSELSHLLNIVKTNSEPVISRDRLEKIKMELSYNLYKPPIEQLIQNIVDSFLSQGIIR